MNTFNFISGMCSIIGLVLSVYATSQVVKIKKQINKNSVEISKNTIKKNTIGNDSIVIGGQSNGLYKR